MFEFNFEAERDVECDAADQSDYTVERLQQLATIAAKLQEAGFKVWFTVTCLAFEPSDSDLLLQDATDFEEYKEGVTAQLAEIGIDDEYSIFPSRTLAELAEAAGKLSDRVWYERKLVLVNSEDYDPAEEFGSHPDITRGMLRKMAQVEQAGLEEEFPVESDFGWGMINGKLSALRWMYGMEWDMLDT